MRGITGILLLSILNPVPNRVRRGRDPPYASRNAFLLDTIITITDL